MRKLLFILFSIAIVSCKKDKTANCRLSSIRDESTSLQLNYDYDQQGRLIKISSTSPATDATIINYFSDSVVTSQGNTITAYYLNSSGLATSSKTRYLVNPDGLSLDDTYTYDAQGYLTNVREVFLQVYNGSTLKDTADFVFTVQNGNIVRYQGFQNGVLNTESQYDYSSQAAPSNIALVLNRWYPQAYLGKAPKNLVSVIKDRNGSPVSSFSYEFDSNGNIINRKETVVSSNNSFVTKYNYQCD